MPTLPADFTTQVASSTSAMFANISPIVILVGGLIAAALIVDLVLSIIRVAALGVKYNKINN